MFRNFEEDPCPKMSVFALPLLVLTCLYPQQICLYMYLQLKGYPCINLMTGSLLLIPCAYHSSSSSTISTIQGNTYPSSCLNNPHRYRQPPSNTNYWNKLFRHQFRVHNFLKWTFLRCGQCKTTAWFSNRILIVTSVYSP